MDLFTVPINNISGVSVARLKCLNKLGIFSIGDFLYFFPKGYENRTNFLKISELYDGCEASVKAKVIDLKIKKTPRITVINVLVEDDSGMMKIVFFNKAFISSQLKIGEEYIFFSKISSKYGQFEMSQPTFEKLEKNTFAQNLIPKYGLTKGMTQGVMIMIAKNVLLFAKNCVSETLDLDFRNKYNLCELLYALNNIHFPKDEQALLSARKRLSFEELFYLIFGLFKLKAKNTKLAGPKFSNFKIVEKMAEILPFPLTNAQKRVVREICVDFKTGFQMHRLTQGDVGSGKTIVAAMAMLIAVESGYQTALMAPTEILARQHFEGLKKYFDFFNLKTELLVSSIAKKEKEKTLEGLENGEIDIVIGTHSILYDKVKFKNFGLGITDEQHRFGVKDRSRLTQKGENPHILVMTATPIPRTLALIIYGDLDVSIIDELPAGRIPIITKINPIENRKKVYDFVNTEISAGNQAFVVCPIIEESETLELTDVIQFHKELEEKYLPTRKIALLHGKMKSAEKDEIMRKFKDKHYDVIVSTTVIEVGVNIPDATVMVVENAEQFGLASLHQLRDRKSTRLNSSH